MLNLPPCDCTASILKPPVVVEIGDVLKRLMRLYNWSLAGGAVLGRAVEPLGGGPLLEEVHH